MSAPAHQAAHEQRYHRALALDTLAALGLGTTVALVTALLPTIARRDTGLGAASSSRSGLAAGLAGPRPTGMRGPPRG